MTAINNKLEKALDLRPKITVVGVGGAGGNAVNNMIRAKLEGVEFVVANTDAQALEQSLVEPKRRIQLGLTITQGLGAGSKPDVGRASAEESNEEILGHLRGSNMVFITGGMGGGTGTGAGPVIARAARESGILTVGVVTKPFHFEGTHRMRTAERGIEELQQYVDTLIIIPNQNLFRIANERTTFADAFTMADDVLYSGVRGVTDLMMMPGLINLDFADIRAVMAEMGKAMMGTGEAEGDRRALDAAEAAISNPLLDDVSMKGAKGVLINITGGFDMTLYEVDEAANRIRDEVDSEANIIFGSTFDEKLNGQIRVSVVATGIGVNNMMGMNHHSNTHNVVQHPKTEIEKPAQPHFSHTNHTDDDYTNVQNFEDQNSELDEQNHQNHVHGVQDETQPHDLTSPFHSMDESETEHVDGQDNHNDSFKPSKRFSASYEEETDVQPKRKSISLFERFTGVGRSRATVQTQTPKVTNSSDIDEEDSELLEIPAFLRRSNRS